MDQNEICEPKKKRVRLNPTKRWTVAEERALVELLMANRDFEAGKPTSQVLYKRFAEEASINLEWKLIRAKVRNMRLNYSKAKAWEDSTGAGSMEGETLKATLLKIFAFYYEFDEIFGGRLVGAAVIADSLNDASSDSFSLQQFQTEETSTPTTSFRVEGTGQTNRRGIYSRTALSDLREIYSESLNLKMEKLGQEATLREREVNIKERVGSSGKRNRFKGQGVGNERTAGNGRTES